MDFLPVTNDLAWEALSDAFPGRMKAHFSTGVRGLQFPAVSRGARQVAAPDRKRGL